MTVIYLDWNIFNKLEKIAGLTAEEQPAYQSLQDRIVTGGVVVPYSNAHINDLYRGYIKSPAYTPAHLANISRLTHQLCLVQYWKEKDVRWHYRDPEGFLMQTGEEQVYLGKTYRSFLYNKDIPESIPLWDVHCLALEKTPVPAKFQDLYAADPVFLSIFPRTKTGMNMLALCEDILSFSMLIKTDYALYKNFRKYLTGAQQQFPTLANINKATQQIGGIHASLTWNELWEKVIPAIKPSPNQAFDRIIHLFTTTDLKGYQADERFANLIDDALHSFYAAHCAYFITLDKRCADKAKKVYESLKIPTKVLSPQEFMKRDL